VTAVDHRLVDDFVRAATSPDDSVAAPALLAARIAYPTLEPDRWLAALDALGETARQHLELGVGGRPSRRTRLRMVSNFFFGQLGFAGNREQYEDPRNSFLNDVIERRTGIPITLAVVFIEVARRAGLVMEGVNFPGHFLMRCPPEPGDRSDVEPLIVDPFHGGAVLSDADCARLLRTHVGIDLLHPSMLQPAGKRAILLRMLLNLKRAYVRIRAFRMAHDVSDLVVALDPSALMELRDRGLLASHLQEYGSALRDLENFLRLTGSSGQEAAQDDVKEVWDHVKALRRRLASLN
jgi:regulator of sirC expression with transglutaminase-like and TPR domain